MNLAGKLQLKTVQIPEDARDMKTLGTHGKRFWSEIIGGNCPAIKLYEGIKRWSQSHCHNRLPNFKEKKALGAIAGVSQCMTQLLSVRVTKAEIRRGFDIRTKTNINRFLDNLHLDILPGFGI